MSKKAINSLKKMVNDSDEENDTPLDYEFEVFYTDINGKKFYIKEDKNVRQGILYDEDHEPVEGLPTDQFGCPHPVTLYKNKKWPFVFNPRRNSPNLSDLMARQYTGNLLVRKQDSAVEQQPKAEEFDEESESEDEYEAEVQEEEEEEEEKQIEKIQEEQFISDEICLDGVIFRKDGGQLNNLKVNSSGYYEDIELYDKNGVRYVFKAKNKQKRLMCDKETNKLKQMSGYTKINLDSSPLSNLNREIDILPPKAPLSYPPDFKQLQIQWKKEEEEKEERKNAAKNSLNNVINIDLPKPNRIPKYLQKKNIQLAVVEKIEEKWTNQIVSFEQAEAYEKLHFAEKDRIVRVDGSRQAINVVLLGEQKSGKSTLAGRILKNFGEVDELHWAKADQLALKNNQFGTMFAQYMHKYTLESQNKCDFIENGRATIDLKDRRVVFVDVPGNHKNMQNLIEGVCQADCVVLVISACSHDSENQIEIGKFVGSSIQEQVRIARMFGIDKIICAVTQMGKIAWDQKRYEKIRDSVHDFLINTVGFIYVDWVPIDAVDDQNVGKMLPEDKKETRSQNSFSDSATLLDKINAIQVPWRNSNGPLRIPILHVAKVDAAMYVFGKIESGTVHEGNVVTVMPNNQSMEVAAIFNSKDEQVLFATAGDIVKVQMISKSKDFKEDYIASGSVLCTIQNECLASQTILAEITIDDFPENMQIIAKGYHCMMHLHTIVAEIEIESVRAIVDPVTMTKTKAEYIKSGETGIVKIQLSTPISFEKFTNMHKLGRFVIRDKDFTIGSGKITMFQPMKIQS